MYPHQKPTANIRKWYRSIMEISTMIVLVLLVTAFYGFPEFTPSAVLDSGYVPPTQTLDLPPTTDHFDPPPRPVRPSLPIASDDIDIDDALTADPIDLTNYTAVADIPPLAPIPDPIFIIFEEQPVPIGGYAALARNVVYPEIAQEAGIEGKVIVQVIITKTGTVLDPQILSGIPNTGLNEAAIAAILKTKWKPALQRDRPVSVKVAIPVDFRLK